MTNLHLAFRPRRVAVVTGAARGIGFAAARRFASLGTRLCLAALFACARPAATSTTAVGNRIPMFVAQGPDSTLTSIPSSVVSLTLPDGQYLFEGKFLYLTSSEGPVPVSCNFPDGTQIAFLACSESNQVLNPPIAYNSMDGHLLCAGKVRNGPVTVNIECNVTEGLGSVTLLRPVLIAIPAALSVQQPTPAAGGGSGDATDAGRPSR